MAWIRVWWPSTSILVAYNHEVGNHIFENHVCIMDLCNDSDLFLHLIIELDKDESNYGIFKFELVDKLSTFFKCKLPESEVNFVNA